MNKKIALAAFAALGMASVASAATYEVRLTGSTAGRSSVHTAIQNIMTGEVITQDNAALGSANKANFVGTVGGDTVTVRCAWTGSAAGVQTMDTNADVTFMAEVAGGVVTTPTALVAKADIGFSDVFQSSTIFTSQPLVDQQTIVLPFKFLTSEGSPITNVQAVAARTLFGNGAVPLALFTGNPAHQTAGVIATGRDNLSGTRITTMAEIGYGVFTTVSHYKPVTVGSNITLAGGATTSGSPIVTVTSTTGMVANQGIRGTGIPANTKVLTVDSATQFTMADNATATGSGLTLFAGLNAATHTNVANGGEASGSGVATNVAVSTKGLTEAGLSPCYYLGYAGISDATTAITNGAIECTYHGVAYSATNVREGLYTIWGYLHLLTRSDLITPTADAFATSLVTQLDAIPGSSGLQLSLMNVSRLSDGGLIAPTYF